MQNLLSRVVAAVTQGIAEVLAGLNITRRCVADALPYPASAAVLSIAYIFGTEKLNYES